MLHQVGVSFDLANTLIQFFVLFLLLQLLLSLFVYEFCNNIGSSSDCIPSNGRVAVNNVLEGMWKEARFSLHLCLHFFTVLFWILSGSRQMQIFSTQEEEGPIILNMNSFTIVLHSVPPDLNLFLSSGMNVLIHLVP